ncbi:PilX N-terminal domain-containing pilus assembly protein [Halomonas sp. H5]|uniref:PilX N-terminal domain-containing pilus assembly protein n=1 Tax=Halomonas sp. H5 TaxID=3423910 RepID=UPI003D35B596
MMNTQKGAALVVSLVLLVVALLLGLSSMNSSRLEESMTGNHRALNLAHLASEAGASRVFQALRSEGWPESEVDADELVDSVLSGDTSVGDYSSFSIIYMDPVEEDEVCWYDYDAVRDEEFYCGDGNHNPEYNLDDDYFIARVRGSAERGEVESRLVSKFRQMPGFSDGAAYTCFGSDCSDTVQGNSDLTGEDYHVPEVFDCSGNHCIADPNDSGSDQDDAYYPDAEAPPEEECNSYSEGTNSDGSTYIECDGRIYGNKEGYGDQDQWYAYLDFVETSGFDVVLEQGDELSFNVGDRNDYDSSLYYDGLEPAGFWDSISPRFIEVTNGSEVSVKASTNTLGVIVIREGAVFDYHGTSTHEGLIIVEPGGTLKFSSGNPQVYGGVVALESATGEMGEVITGDLEISGNMGIHYSSLAFEMLRQGGKGIRLMSWYVDVSGT